MSDNKNLHTAKKVKNDEFYTKYEDIKNELKYYTEYFENKIIYCNCDDYLNSNFVKYFIDNFTYLKIKKLISTGFLSKKLFIYDGKNTIIEDLNSGDFRDNIIYLKECDVVITNPPFSLFREYMDIISKYNKEFLVLGNLNAITYKEIYTQIKENKIWMGKNFNKNLKFTNNEKKVAIAWYTNIKNVNIKPPKLKCKEIEKYDIYDNYNAINIDKLSDFPPLYDDIIGCPITILGYLKYDGKIEINGIKYDIIKFRKGNDNKDLKINGKDKYFRILIKKIK